MANQAKANNLTFINDTVVYKYKGELHEVPMRWAVNLTDASTKEVELALLLEQGEVKIEDVAIRIDSIRSNVQAKSATGESKEDLMSKLDALRGVSAVPATPATPAVEDDDIPF